MLYLKSWRNQTFNPWRLRSFRQHITRGKPLRRINEAVNCCDLAENCIVFNSIVLTITHLSTLWLLWLSIPVFREMMNFLTFAIRSSNLVVWFANYLVWMDRCLFVVGGSTFVFLGLGLILFGRSKNKFLFDSLIRLDHFLFAIFFSISMFTIALELLYLQSQPFFPITGWLTVWVIHRLIGAIVINQLSKRIPSLPSKRGFENTFLSSGNLRTRLN